MPADAPVNFTFAGLPEGYCFTTPQRFALDIVAQMTGYIPGEYSVIIKSDTEPVAADRNKDWHKLIGDEPTGEIYSWYLGKWVRKNPFEASGDFRLWWEGTEANVWAFDGGDGTDPSAVPPTAITGAMWEVDHNYDFRFPLGAGTSPKPTTASVGGTGGEEEHSLIVSELAPHTHDISTPAAATDDIPSTTVDGGTNPDPVVTVDFVTESAGGAGTPPVVVPHQNMPPWRAGYWIMRTSRIFLTA